MRLPLCMHAWPHACVRCRHVDLHNMAWDQVTKAMDSTLQHEKAGPLFDKAADSFRDVACMGLNNWGMVHQMQGTRMLDSAMRSGGCGGGAGVRAGPRS